jgi:hypothetical protein
MQIESVMPPGSEPFFPHEGLVPRIHRGFIVFCLHEDEVSVELCFDNRSRNGQATPRSNCSWQ